MYIYISAYVYIYMYIHIYIYICIHLCMYIYIHMFLWGPDSLGLKLLGCFLGLPWQFRTSDPENSTPKAQTQGS